jgi:hypothetical protein
MLNITFWEKLLELQNLRHSLKSEFDRFRFQRNKFNLKYF